jgi:2',3'-cyclic-nucleotide 2'-phosphodiesterase / 3'-nucleotidase
MPAGPTSNATPEAANTNAPGPAASSLAAKTKPSRSFLNRTLWSSFEVGWPAVSGSMPRQVQEEVRRYLLMGHSHLPFPLATSTVPQFNLANVDKTAGTVFGVPSVMGNYWGKSLGVIQLNLVNDGAKWSVDKTKTVAQLQNTLQADGGYVDPDPTIAPLVEYEHQATISYVKTPLGTSDFELNTYFAAAGDVTALELVNQAQADYVKTYVTNNLPALASLPVLSVTAPFKSGFGGATDFTDVAQGNVAINNAADLYLYANTVYAVKVTGANIKAWMEKAATWFNTIDPSSATKQQLINPAFPGYNFDVFTDADLSYEIDVTQPVGSRIKNLTYKGAAMDPGAEFVVATNNYRASGGGSFPGLDGTKTILAAPDTNRDVLIAYIKKLGALTKAANGSARSCRFTKVTTAGPVVFYSALNKLSLATTVGLTNVSGGTVDDGTNKGLGVYTIDLSQ